MNRIPSYAAVVVILVLFASAVSFAEDSSEKTHISLKVHGMPFPDVIDVIREKTGANIFLARDSFGVLLHKRMDLKVTLTQENVHWETALRQVCRSLGLFLDKYHDSVWRVYQPVLVSLKIDELDLNEALFLAARASGKAIAWQTKAVQGKTVSINVKDRPWYEVIEALAQNAGLVLLKDSHERTYILAKPAFAWESGENWYPYKERLSLGYPDEGPRVSEDLKEKPLMAIAAFLSVISGKKIIDKRRRRRCDGPELRATIKLMDVHWLTFLNLSAESAGVYYERIDDETWLLHENGHKKIAFKNLHLQLALKVIMRMQKMDIKYEIPSQRNDRVSFCLHRNTYPGSGAWPAPPWPSYKDVLRAIAGAAGMVLEKGKEGAFELRPPEDSTNDGPDNRAEGSKALLLAWRKTLKLIEKRIEEKHDNLKLYLKLKVLLEDVQRHDFSDPEEINRANLLCALKSNKKSISNSLLSEIVSSSRDLMRKMMSLSKDRDNYKSQIMSLFLNHLPRHISASRLIIIDDKDISSSREIFSRVLVSILMEDKRLDDFLEYSTELISRIRDDRSQISYCMELWRDIQPMRVIALALKKDFLDLGLCLQGFIWEPNSIRRIAIVNGVYLLRGQAIPLLQFGVPGKESLAPILDDVQRSFVIIKYQGYLCRLRMKEGKQD